MPCSGWLTPRTVVDRAGLWDETLSVNDDGEYFTRVLLESDTVCFCEQAKVYYRSEIHGSLSKLTGRSGAKSLLDSHCLQMKHIRAKEDSIRVRQACATNLQRFIYDIYPEHPDLLERATHLVRELGGSDLRPQSGAIFNLLRPVLGWRFAKRLQKLVYRFGYDRIGIGRFFSKRKPFRRRMAPIRR